MQLLRLATILITIAIVWPVSKTVASNVINPTLLHTVIIAQTREFILDEVLVETQEFLLNTGVQEYGINNITRNVNSSFSIVTMRRVAIRFFELGVVKHFMQKFYSQEFS